MEHEIIERIALDNQFQAACQRYAHGNGSSHAIAGAAARAMSAPELVVALQGALGCLETGTTSLGVIRAARAAIAKATGEPQ